jgi:hypothetical protein
MPVYEQMRLIDPNFHSNSDTFYVLIPNSGCPGCITQAEYFVQKNVALDAPIKFVFTRIHSVKELKFKIGEEVAQHTRVILDTNNRIKYPDPAKAIYPLVLYPKKFDYKIEYQSPVSDGLLNLLKNLTK